MFCMSSLLDYAQRYEAVTPALRVAASFGSEALGTAQFGSVRDEAVTLEPADRPGRSRHARAAHDRAHGRGPPLLLRAHALRADRRRRHRGQRRHRRAPRVQRAARRAVGAAREPDADSRGELVRVDVYVSLPTARNFVVIDDPVPGGLEPVNRDLANASLVDADAGTFQAAGGAWWFRFNDWQGYGASRWSFYHQELRHDAVRFYSEYLPPGNYHVSYTAQAIAVGEFTVMPTHAEEMYDPDVYGNSLPGTLSVDGGGAMTRRVRALALPGAARLLVAVARRVARAVHAAELPPAAGRARLSRRQRRRHRRSTAPAIPVGAGCRCSTGAASR